MQKAQQRIQPIRATWNKDSDWQKARQGTEANNCNGYTYKHPLNDRKLGLNWVQHGGTVTQPCLVGQIQERLLTQTRSHLDPD